MGFDSIRKFAPPTILEGLLLCPWMWGISSQLPQCLPPYWGFSDLGRGVSPHGQSSKTQLTLLTLNVGDLLRAAHQPLQCHAAATCCSILISSNIVKGETFPILFLYVGAKEHRLSQLDFRTNMNIDKVFKQMEIKCW